MFLRRSLCTSARRLSPFVIPQLSRGFGVVKGKRDFITSECVDREQLTPALQQYFKFKEQYKGAIRRME